MQQDGLTPVLLALHGDKKELVTVLIENGADINTPSADVRKIATHLLLSFLTTNLY